MIAPTTLESRLAGDIGRRHCIAVGRGATAIWLGLQAIGERGAARRVVLPATLCTSPVAVTQAAGFEPVFCDVDPLTGNLDPAALAQILDQTEGVACVMAAHLFGQPARIGEIAALCSQRHIPLLEDAAQAFGADIDGAPAGAFGDVSILSFGHSKILDAGGGGAILTDDEPLAARLRDLAAALPAPSPSLAAWSADYRTLYYKIIEDLKISAEHAVLVGQFCEAHPDFYRYALTVPAAERVLGALDSLADELSHRRAMAAIYRRELAGAGVALMTETAGGAPWRFNILVPGGRRDAVAAGLRAAGHDASPWYPVVAKFFTAATRYAARWPGAARLEQEILNLWVDHSVDETRIRGACAVIRDCL